MKAKFVKRFFAIVLSMALPLSQVTALATETTVADGDAKIISVKETSARVDYISDVVYKQISTTSTNQSLKMEMLLPKLKNKAPTPVVVFVKGSGFTAMNMDGFMQQRMYLAEAGYAVISVETRVVPQVTFPAAIVDVKAAIRYIRAHAEQFNLDTDKIAIWGDSSGGYAAAFAALTNGVEDFEEGDNLDYSSDIALCIDFYGPTDLTTIGKGLGKEIEDSHMSASTTEALLINGTAFGDNPGGSITSDREKADYANPIKYIDENDPPFLIFHGTADTLVSSYESKILYQGLKEAGVPADLIMVEGAGHGTIEFFQPQLLNMVVEFLNSNMAIS